MIELDIPGRGRLVLAYLVLDVNGTLAVDGTLLPGVLERIQQLRRQLQIALLTADAHGRQAELDQQPDLRSSAPRQHGQGRRPTTS